MGINQVADALKTALDTALTGLINASYDYETMPGKLDRSYILFWIGGAPKGTYTLEQGGRYQDFAIVPTAKYENTPASQRAADRGLNDITDAIYDYLDTSINQTYWTRVLFPQDARRGGPHPDITQTFWRVIPIRVLLR